jgi:hypothetical protein
MKPLHLRWPPRAAAWAMPAGVLGERIVQLLYPPLALAALLLPAPAGRPRVVLDRGQLWPLLAIFLWGLVSILWTTAPEYAIERWPAAFGLSLPTLASCGAAASATPEERHLVAGTERPAMPKASTGGT